MELALTAIFQNEAPYLKEWIDFHQKVGVEFFHLFDHMSTDAPEKILKPYIKQGIVELTRWPIAYSDVYEWTEVQCLAYERAVHFATGKTKWLAILDVDEFLLPVAGSLREILKAYEDFGGLCVNWQVYGTSNVAKIPSGQQMIETLTWKAHPMQATNQYVKSIVRPERVKGFDNAHSALYKEGFFQVNTNQERFEGPTSLTIEIDRLRINHYTLRDEHYLITQKIPRIEKWWPSERKSIDAWKKHFSPMNWVEDRAIHSLLTKPS
ncbi:MAG: glycosyltransferase family 92 protein [Verrucomicrobia bacterium]|nr:glycosyltransferase family 92 protein [Verrucomicrobiota bacterium]MBU6446967.1 glycosyltransferase family 92 protein [Verrucomicrobiota bacterium]MDE3046857.1 glycosyltransferase family 92 protein [Verrucomicrobiota bacterium]